jgi:hypothetical protein
MSGVALRMWCIYGLAFSASVAHAGCPKYAPIDVGQRVQRPESVQALLQNLKIAWDDNFLLMPSFFLKSNLKRFFNASSVTWGPPPFPPRVREALVVPDPVIFGLTKISARPESPQNPTESGLAGGGVTVDVDPKFDVTVGEVREVFGTESRTAGPPAPTDILPYDGMPQGGGPTITYDKPPEISGTGCSTRPTTTATFTVKYVGAPFPRLPNGTLGRLPDTAIVTSILLNVSAE